ncbi:MAG: FG-GAP-like repeat-containing protein [Nitrospinales bacterium]
MKRPAANFKSLLIAIFGIAVSVSSANAKIAFDPPRISEGGDGMRAMVSVDLNGDGLLDLAAASKSSGMASVFLNKGAPTFFAAPVNYPAGIFPFDITAADFNGDGSPDLAVANAASNNVSVLLNNGDGSFQTAVNTGIGVGAEPQGIAAGDFDGDGDVDLVTANTGSASVTLLLNNGSGNFSVGKTIQVGPKPVSVVAADLDNDLDLDLAVLNNGIQFEILIPGRFLRHFGTVSVLLSNNDGTFATETRYEVAQNPFQVIAADLDGDGFVDLATANHMVTSAVPHQWVSVLRNNGDPFAGTFAAERKVVTQSHQGTVAAADLDADGRLDLISSNTSVFHKYEVMKQNIDGTFAASLAFPLGAMNGVIFLTTGDYDKDGDADIVTASADTDVIGLYLNQKVANPPPPLSVTGKPDLTVEIAKQRMKFNRGVTQLEVEFLIKNIGDGPAASGGIWGGRVYVSTDDILDDADTQLRFFLVNTVAGLLPGDVDKHKIKKNIIGDLLGQYVLIEVDSGNLIAELDETNNFIARKIK